MECSGNGVRNAVTLHCTCFQGWSGTTLWSTEDDCQVSDDVVLVVNVTALILSAALFLLSTRMYGSCAGQPRKRDDHVSVLSLFINQFIFAICGVFFYTLALKGITHETRNPGFLAIYSVAASAFLSQILVISFLWIQSSPDHSRVPKLASFGMAVSWTFGVGCGMVGFLDASQYTILLQAVTGGIALGSLISWVLLAYSVGSVLRVLQNLRRAEDSGFDHPPLPPPRKSNARPSTSVSSSPMPPIATPKAKAPSLNSDSILDRMTFRARTTAVLLVIMGIPSICVLVCLVVPVLEVERYSHFFFNAVLMCAMLLSIRINIMYTCKSPESTLDSLAKTKRAFSRATPLSINNGSDSSASSSLLVRNQREESQTIDRPFAQRAGSV